MGNYASVADVKARFENDMSVAFITDTADTTGVPDEDVINEGIQYGEGEIDSYVNVRHHTPLAVAGDSVLAAFFKSLTVDFAVYHLVRRGRASGDARQAVEDGREWLTKLARGAIELPKAETHAATTARGTLMAWGTAGETSDSKRVFSRHTQEKL
ncbi:MAG: DUF1320 domain-containing protein [Phycisphaerales bacterium]|nr:MAG: DUF1320 domain-containing protein [Phycisphaerales bacterium]